MKQRRTKKELTSKLRTANFDANKYKLYIFVMFISNSAEVRYEEFPCGESR